MVRSAKNRKKAKCVAGGQSLKTINSTQGKKKCMTINAVFFLMVLALLISLLLKAVIYCKYPIGLLKKESNHELHGTAQSAELSP
jgi:hypothetical protein